MGIVPFERGVLLHWSSGKGREGNGPIKSYFSISEMTVLR